MRVTNVNNCRNFLSLGEEWNNLLSKSSSNNIFSSFEWLYTWWEYFKDKKEMLILTVLARNCELIGTAPLMVTKRKLLGITFLREMRFIGDGYSDYADFICLAGKEKEVLTVVFDYLENNHKNWDSIVLDEIPETSPTLGIIENLMKSKKYDFEVTVQSTCPYIKLSKSWKSYESTLSKKMRQNTVYCIRRLDREFDFRVRVIDSEEALEDAIRTYIELHQKRWRKVEMPGTFANKKFSQFFKDVLHKFYEKGWLRLSLLYLDGEATAAISNFRYCSRTYYYGMGFDPDFKKYSLGHVLISFSIKYSIESNDKEFDFLRGEEEYKYRWNAIDKKNMCIKIIKFKRKYALYWGIYSVLRKVHQKIKGVR